MRVSRRQFLGCAAAVALPRWRLALSTPATRPARIAILGLENDSRRSEAVRGFESVLETRALPAVVLQATPPATLIVPAVVDLPAAAIAAIFACLEHRGCVVLESGAGFASGAECRAHCLALRDHFGVNVEPPRELWPAMARSRVPYVDFTWPFPVKIRDFSRVVPLRGGAGEVIARVDGLPVALKRQRGRGTLIVLGSPLGPGLWAGDVEARRWVEAAAKT